MNEENSLKQPTNAVRSLIKKGLHRFTIEELSLNVSQAFNIPLSTNLKKSLYQAAKRLAIKGELKVSKTRENLIQYSINDEIKIKEKQKPGVSQNEKTSGQYVSEIRASLINFEDEYFTKMEAANFCLKQINQYPQFKKKLTELHQIKRHESLIALARTEVLSAILEEI